MFEHEGNCARQIIPQASDAKSFEGKLKAEREALLNAWIAFLELQRQKKVPFPPQYADAFYAAAKINQKENYILNLLIECKGLFNTLLQKIHPEAAATLGLTEDLNRIINYVRRIEQLEEELSFLRESYLRDQLTGLWNQNALQKFFYEVVKENIFEQDYLLCYFDLDKFKSINDHYGHRIGDKVLIAFANFLRHNLKRKDFPVRLHGDEFSAVLVGARIEDFIPFAERLYEEGMMVNLPDGQKKISFSIGITNIIAADTLEAVLERADFSMYWCKQHKGIKPVRV